MSNKSLAKAPENLTVLVTGGAGFIGSHTAVELLHGGYNVVIVDDLSNSNEKAVDRIRTIVGPDAAERLTFYRNNVLDRQAMERVFSENDVDVMIHFAGFKAVGESVQKPLEYYRNNIGGTLVLCDVARNHGCKNIVFSSSATVYGDSEDVPFDENQPLGETTNPYGTSKAMQERVFNTTNIEVMFNHNTAEVLGDESGVTGALLRCNDGKEVKIDIAGFFLAIGHHPNTELFADQLTLDAEGYIKTEAGTSKTNIEGVFAAGDVRDPHYRQAITAAASGCIAAIDCERFILSRAE